MPLPPSDLTRLEQALAHAQTAVGVSEPNPRVGCVIGRADGSTLGIGVTQHVGGPHAEVMALRQAEAVGHDVRGATVWVTLEPCAHHGRTPPCCDALIAAGIGRVVAAVQDPNPLVAGQGFARLRAAAVQVDVADGALAQAAIALNIGFFSRCIRARPWVRVKIAASVDGCTALLDGTSQWITGTAARADGHAWRKRAGAVLTGTGTVLADDPRLDVRLVPTQLQPLRVVVDSRLQMPLAARVLQPPGRVLIATTSADAGQRQALQTLGVEVLRLEAVDDHVDLVALMTALAQRGVNELHVEAGARLNGVLLRLGLIDELLIYMAPAVLGMGRGMFIHGPLDALTAARRFAFSEAVRVGEDLRLSLQQPASLQALSQ